MRCLIKRDDEPSNTLSYSWLIPSINVSSKILGSAKLPKSVLKCANIPKILSKFCPKLYQISKKFVQIPSCFCLRIAEPKRLHQSKLIFNKNRFSRHKCKMFPAIQYKLIAKKNTIVVYAPKAQIFFTIQVDQQKLM